MASVQVEHHPDESQLDKLGAKAWPIWEKEVSEFP